MIHHDAAVVVVVVVVGGGVLLVLGPVEGHVKRAEVGLAATLLGSLMLERPWTAPAASVTHSNTRSHNAREVSSTTLTHYSSIIH